MIDAEHGQYRKKFHQLWIYNVPPDSEQMVETTDRSALQNVHHHGLNQ
jgi:hypothetical protein